MAGAAARWSLLAGNFAIGCGVMVVPGSLNDLVRSLQVSVPVGGQLVSTAAVTMAIGAPLLAVAVSGFDRRRLLAFALLWYAAGHAACALAPDFAALLPLRALTVLGAALFTPQAAAALAWVMPPAERGRAIAFAFVGWSLASVLGMPMASLVGEALGWRWAFAGVALLALATMAAVWHALPDGIRPAAMSLGAWRRTLTHPLLMGVVGVTALNASGQFTLFPYLAPYFHDRLGAGAAGISGLFMCFGLFGLIGNVMLQRWVDRIGPARCATAMLALIALSMALWPLAATVAAMAVVFTPWALGCFSSNSAQQARLGGAAPALAPALMALNTSAMYLGQAIGAASGGALVAAAGFGALSPSALGWMLASVAASAWLGARMRGFAHA